MSLVFNVDKPKTQIFLIECRGPIEFSVEMSVCLEDGEEVLSIIEENIEEIFDDEYVQDSLNELVDNYIYEYLPSSPFGLDLNQIQKELYTTTHNKINALNEALILTAQEIGTTDAATRYAMNSRIIIDNLHDRVNAREECEQADCDAGTIVERCLLNIEKEGVWQYGLMNDEIIITDILKWPVPCNVQGKPKWFYEKKELTPILWFGILGMDPDPKWTISISSDNTFGKFWFSDESWDIIKYLVENADDIFLTWYFPECGFDSPDMESIMDRCPVAFTKDDINSVIEDKIREFFICNCSVRHRPRIYFAMKLQNIWGSLAQKALKKLFCASASCRS